MPGRNIELSPRYFVKKFVKMLMIYRLLVFRTYRGNTSIVRVDSVEKASAVRFYLGNNNSSSDRVGSR